MRKASELRARYYEELLVNPNIIPVWCKKSAIIGMSRQGATIEEIAEIMGILKSTIEDIIFEYFKNAKL